MTEGDVHFRFVHSFLTVCGRDLVERGIFSTQAEFENLAHDRLSEYLNAIIKGDPEKSMMGVATAFLINAGCSADDIALRLGAVGSFVSQSVGTKELFDEVKRSVRLVPE
jgi:hypothetical protein